MNSIIYYDIDTGNRVNQNSSSPITQLPQFYYATTPQIQFTFVSGGSAVDLSHLTGWRAAIDTEFDASTPPVCRTDNTGIDSSTAASGIITVTFDCRTAEFLTKLGGRQKVNAWLDVYGMNGDGDVEFIAQMPVQLVGVIDPEQGTPPIVPDLYPSTAAVQSMINSAVAGIDAKLNAKQVYQYSADGSSWHDTFQTGDQYMRERADFEGAEWSDAYPISPPTVFTNAIDYEFSTTSGQAAELTFTAAELGIAADAEPQVSLWFFDAEIGGWKRVADTTYTVTWVSGSGELILEYYQAWISGSWKVKLS